MNNIQHKKIEIKQNINKSDIIIGHQFNSLYSIWFF